MLSIRCSPLKINPQRSKDKRLPISNKVQSAEKSTIAVSENTSRFSGVVYGFSGKRDLSNCNGVDKFVIAGLNNALGISRETLGPKTIQKIQNGTIKIKNYQIKAFAENYKMDKKKQKS